MAAADKILKNWQLFVDGRGKAGNCTAFTPPTLALKTEDLEAGGLDSAIEIEIGQEKMESSFTLSEFDPDTLALWGVGPQRDVAFVARGSVQGLNGAPQPVEHYLRGRIRSIEPGEWNRGQVTNVFQISLTYYKYTHAGRVIHEIDVVNMIRFINGVDALAAHRTNIGL